MTYASSLAASNPSSYPNPDLGMSVKENGDYQDLTRRNADEELLFTGGRYEGQSSRYVYTDGSTYELPVGPLTNQQPNSGMEDPTPLKPSLFAITPSGLGQHQ